MKKEKLLAVMMVLTLCVTFLTSVSGVSAYDALSATEIGGGAVKTESGVRMAEPYCYIKFSDVELTGAKSIEITATCNMYNHGDGDIIWVRLDSDKGEVIGTVDISVHTPDEAMVFKGSIKEASGKHDLYLESTIGTSIWSVRNVEIKSLRLSEEEYERPKYVEASDESITDKHYTTLALTDDLGRRVADFEEVGPLKEDKYVGLFYWTWHSDFETAAPVNLSEFDKEHPEARFDYTNEAWPKEESQYFWNEPIFGYYGGTDFWVYRKHAQMLATAGVDAIFLDATNDARSWRRQALVLLEALKSARNDGVDVPKVAFMMPFGNTNAKYKEAVKRVYMGFYMLGDWSDLWFCWDGKPLMMGYTDMLKPREGDSEDEKLMNEIKSFFTFRGGQASYTSGPVSDTQWGWLEIYPQHGFGKKSDGSFEQVTVGVAANYSYVNNVKTAMNDDNVMGRSYTSVLGQDKTEGAYKYGYFFTEQLKHALTVDADILFVDGWNEWMASRYESWGGVENNAFPDLYDNEGSRDMEPTKGDMKDNYYCLLADAARKWKGAEPIPVAGENKTININDISSWENVTPEYLGDKGIYNRDALGYGNVRYENDTMRNNVIRSLAAMDDDNMYFYAECENAITPPSGDKWMKLYIDVDRNHATGYEGYDYVINYPSAGDISSFDALGNSNIIGKAEYAVSGNTLSVKISKSIINTVEFEFKWADNVDNSIMNFYSDGNVTPIGRFNFVYTKRAAEYKGGDKLLGTLTVKAGENYAYYGGKKIYLYEPDIRYGAREINGEVYIPAYALEDAFSLRAEYDNTRGMFKLKSEDLVYSTSGSLEAKINGKAKALSHPVLDIDSIPYVPVSFFNEVYGMELYTTNGNVVIGEKIDRLAADAFEF